MKNENGSSNGEGVGMAMVGVVMLRVVAMLRVVRIGVAKRAGPRGLAHLTHLFVGRVEVFNPQSALARQVKYFFKLK